MSGLVIRRLGYALGAEITGVDLTRPLEADLVAEIRQAWLDHVVLCIPKQALSPAQLEAFAGQFGELDDNRAAAHNRLSDHYTVMPINNQPSTIGGKQFGGGIADMWHSDRAFTDRPQSLAFLNAKALPETGGDTLFANMYLAYETLSPKLRNLIEPLEGVHDVSRTSSFPRLSPQMQAERLRVNPPVVHSLVRVHPETGRKALYVGDRVRNFVGMSEEESRPLVDFLNRHATRYEFTYRHRWNVDDLVIWDNRCAMHLALRDYDLTQHRRMFRCSLLAPKSGYIYQA